MVDRVGQQLGNYRLIRLLGRGGFAEVYLGEHLRLGTYAAVKVVYTRLASIDEVESFQKEARTIAHLEHPHIVRVFDFDVFNDTPFLVMSYAAGGTLRQHHPKGTILPLTTIISYVKQVADALQYAHDQRLIHRDIKPENMLMGGRDEVLLSDFGIAIVAQSSRYQGMQDMAGTIAYMAPEQIQTHPRPASDQYSLGIVVYEWLCGERPFHGSFTEVAIKHSVVPPPSLRERIPMLSPEVEQVVMTALAKDAKERFGSVRAFANALEQAYQSGQERSTATTVKARMSPPGAPPMAETPLSSLVPTPAPPVQPTRETPPAGLTPTRQAAPEQTGASSPSIESLQLSVPAGSPGQPPVQTNAVVPLPNTREQLSDLRLFQHPVFQQEEEQARQVRDKRTRRAKEQVVPLPKTREQPSDLRLFRDPVFQQEEEQARQARDKQIRKTPSQKILLISLTTLICLDIIFAIFAFSGSYIMFIPLMALLLATAYCIRYMIRIGKE
jgi:serine/threonine protein kinase